MPDYKFTVVVERDEDGLYVASAPLLQGCNNRGKPTEALENIEDATKSHIEARQGLGEPGVRRSPGWCVGIAVTATIGDCTRTDGASCKACEEARRVR